MLRAKDSKDFVNPMSDDMTDSGDAEANEGGEVSSSDDENMNSSADSDVTERVNAYEAKGIIEPVFVELDDDNEPAKKKDTSTSETEPGLMAAFWGNFLGHCPIWFKLTMVVFLAINPFISMAAGKKVCAWAVLLEFIFTLAMAPLCYPMQSGGLIVIEAFGLGLATADTMKHEVEMNLNVLLLVAFMVACIHFLKNLLLWIFTKLLIGVESKTTMSVLIMFVAAVLSAFLDALSVAAVLVSVCTGVLGVYFHVVADADLPQLEHLHHETMTFELVPHAVTKAKAHKTDAEVDDILQQIAEKQQQKTAGKLSRKSTKGAQKALGEIARMASVSTDNIY